MQKKNLIFFVLIFVQATLFAQTNPKPVPSPTENDFAPILSFLSSDWMEGREAGARGGFMAADYMASMMQLFGLQPFGDQVLNVGKAKQQQSYFQDFEILHYKTEKSELGFINQTELTQSISLLAPGIDYEVKGGTQCIKAETQVVFAGYGITAVDKGYDDFKSLDVNGKIVVVLGGFPGHADTTSIAWKKFGRTFDEERASLATKLQNAKTHGATALILIDAEGRFEPFKNVQSNQSLMHSTMNSVKNADDEYEDTGYILPNDTANRVIPCFMLGSSAGSQLISGTGLNVAEFEKKTARTGLPSVILIKDKRLQIEVTVKTEPLLVRNVLGMIPGKDPTKYIILGGHYDHLGIHNGQTYNGSDDNGSGASGLLSLAKVWAESGVQPACNLIFASWSAEEKGLLGSQYFVQEMKINPAAIRLYINMDMISRSVVEDTARRQLSIGTRTSDENLRELARKTNVTLSHPFELDLWDVTGHSGSDYGSFTPVNIPVMTYNTGLHNDYHTPRDISANADFVKMGDVLKMVNESLQVILDDLKKN